MLRSQVIPFGVMLFFAVIACGCGGPTRLAVTGRVVKEGAALTMSEGDFLRVTFVPVVGAGEQVTDFYTAIVNDADATFRAAGKDGKGVPPGRYRIAVEHLHNKRDILQGAFDATRSPFVHDIDAQTGELILDLAKPR